MKEMINSKSICSRRLFINKINYNRIIAFNTHYHERHIITLNNLIWEDNLKNVNFL